MKIITNLLIFTFLLSVSGGAQAGWLSEWQRDDTDFRPYAQNGVDQQNVQFRREQWNVTEWAPTPEIGRERMDAFFRAGVFDGYKEDNIFRSSPTLVVGPGFYHLSWYDKQRVITLFDHLYGATSSNAGRISLQDDFTGRVIGYYSRAGLQID